jgi:antitoxin VapB
MPLIIPDEAVNRLADELADRLHTGKTDAVRRALENELRRLDEAAPLRRRLRSIQDQVLARPETGLAADKAFYDALADDSTGRR